MKLTLSVVLVAIFAVGGGWLWGASGKSAIELERRALQDRADLSGARAVTLEGRVSLSLSNYGDAARSFASARSIVELTQTRFRETGQAERAGQLEIVLAHLKDAQRLSAAVDINAQNAADQALQTLRSVEKP